MLSAAETHSEARDGEAERFFRQFETDLRQAVVDGGDTTNMTFFLDGVPLPKSNAGEHEYHNFLCFIRPALPYGRTAERAAPEKDGGMRLSLDCVKYTARYESENYEIIREAHPLYAGRPLGEQTREIWEAETGLTVPDDVSRTIQLSAVLVTAFGPTMLTPPELPLETNALPLGVTLQLRMFKDDAELNVYKALVNEASEEETRRQETPGVPYSRQISFPTCGGEAIL